MKMRPAMIPDELFQRTLTAAYDLHRHRDPHSQELRIAQIAGQMLGCDSALLIAVDVARRDFRLAGWPSDHFQQVDHAAVARLHAAEHPFVARCTASRSVKAIRLSDLAPREQFARTSLYRNLYRFHGIEHQLMMLVASPDALWRVLVLNRKSHDFANEEAVALESLWPHIMLAQRNTRRRIEVQPRSPGVDAVAETAGVMVVNSAALVTLCSEQARTWLAEYFGSSGFGRRISLPAPVQDWFFDRLRRESQGMGLRVERRDPLVITRGDRFLSLDLIIDRGKDLHLLTLEEAGFNAPSPSLQAMGLTQREAEVMSWVAQGKTAREIGMIIGNSARTVQKHMEHIFEKLGVESRTAAILKCWQSARFAAIAGSAITRPSS